jgi:succinylarginine dihydrolase
MRKTLPAANPYISRIATFEANFDGLVGPTHNYAGLSQGNIASQSNAQAVSRPRRAALQGVAKMRAVAGLGFVQGFLPPHERPAIWALRAGGLVGNDEQVLAAAARENPLLLARACSASAMWTANAATIAPAHDTDDGRLHAVVANLRAMPHRSIEPPQTLRTLRALFHDSRRFEVHPALDPAGAFGDEGAANHTRLVAGNAPGIHFFVHGARAAEGRAPTRHPARQTLEASHEVARLLRVPSARCVHAQQSPEAIDAGVFHNDVICVGSGGTLLFHEDAFLESAATIAALERAVGAGFRPLVVHRDELSVAEAVSTYLFNSQLLSSPDGHQILVCPLEVREHPRACAVVDRILGDPSSPVKTVAYLDVRESMRNGGGPACLRLRVPLDEADRAALHPGFLLSPERIAWLQGWIERHYPEELRPSDLCDPKLLRHSRDALDELTRWMGVGAIYPFQGASPP